MSKQKFKRGDLVHIAKDLGPTMSHFTKDADAIVIGSYADQFGGSNHDSYTLHIKGRGECSWYHEHQLTLIDKDCSDLLAVWKAEQEADHKQKADLGWIFDHAEEVLKHGYSASIVGLAKCLGLTEDDLWGSHGEGFTWVTNAMRVLEIAKPFLMSRDLEGWKTFCERYRKPK